MNNEQLIEKIKDAISGMDSSDIVRINNDYAERRFGKKIFKNNDEFLNRNYSNRAPELARAFTYGKYHYLNDWVCFNGFNNLESFDSVNILSYTSNISDLAEFVAENFSKFYDLFDFDENSFDEE